MRLPFPERVPLSIVVLAAILLAAVQQFEQTPLLFSVYSFLFIVIAAIAFNLAGGFTQTSGSYIFFYAVLSVVIGLFYKAYLGERADSNLRSPILTIQVFTGGITGMLIAVFISRKITRKRSFLPNILKEKDMRNAAVGCLIVGCILTFLYLILPHAGGDLMSAIGQLDHFLPMSIIIATIYVIKSSGGRRSFNTLVFICVAVGVCTGIIGFSKQGMFTPLLCWLIAASCLRLRIKPYQIALGAGIVFISFHYLVPYSQYGRNFVSDDTSFSERFHLAYGMFSDLEGVREIYVENVKEAEMAGNSGYYNEPQGFFDRLTMIPPDDSLIDYTNKGNFEGLHIIPLYFINWIPHFLWPDKPAFGPGNYYAHEIGGILGEDDTSTGISFSPSAEAYHLAGWTGVFIVAPVIFIMLFTLFDSLCGDTRKSPWGLLIIAFFSHLAPEGMLGGAIYIMWFGTLALLFVALLTAYVMPLVGTLFIGPESRSLLRMRRVGSSRNQFSLSRN